MPIHLTGVKEVGRHVLVCCSAPAGIQSISINGLFHAFPWRRLILQLLTALAALPPPQFRHTSIILIKFPG
jgi:hypothetical protein